MKTSSILTVAASVAVLTPCLLAFSFGYPQAGVAVPKFYVYNQNQMVAQPIPQNQKTKGLPCSGQGFFNHPSNCSRFYRCVDFTGTGAAYSTYEFSCPVGLVFVTHGKDTCVPGDCADGAPAPAPAPTPATQAPAVTYPPLVTQPPATQAPAVTYPPLVTQQAATQPPAVTYPPVVVPQAGSTGAVVGGTQPQVVGVQPTGTVGVQTQPGVGVQPSVAGTSQPQVGVQPGGVYPQPGVASDSATPPVAAVSGNTCAQNYVQDEQFCNIYHACPDDGKKYLCTIGSAFNQAQQLCDLDGIDQLCAGKSFQQSNVLRSLLPVNVAPLARTYRTPNTYANLGYPLQTVYTYNPFNFVY